MPYIAVYSSHVRNSRIRWGFTKVGTRHTVMRHLKLGGSLVLDVSLVDWPSGVSLGWAPTHTKVMDGAWRTYGDLPRC